MSIWLQKGDELHEVEPTNKVGAKVAKRLLASGFVEVPDPSAPAPEPVKKPVKASKAATEAEG